MTNSSDERISALMDGELEPRVYSGTVDELLENDEARNTWARYHLISDTLRQHIPSGMDNQFSSRVMAALEDEPTVLAPPPVKTSPITRGLAGLAVAASVAAVAVVGVQTMYKQDLQSPLQNSAAQVAQAPSTLLPQTLPQASLQTSLQTSLQSSPQLPSRFSSPSSKQTFARAVMSPKILPNVQTVTQSSASVTRPSQLAKRVRPNLNKYLVGHNQQVARPIAQGVMPYARIAAYPNSRYSVIQSQK